jgi:hypothetical protein
MRPSSFATARLRTVRRTRKQEWARSKSASRERMDGMTIRKRDLNCCQKESESFDFPLRCCGWRGKRRA